jgi:hypothetical protein
MTLNNIKPPDPRRVTRLAGERAYWLPGVDGVVVEAALADFAGHPGDARLVISKRRTNGVMRYVVELDKTKT